MNEIIQYVRNKKNERIGVVVAVKNDKPLQRFSIGWSKCHNTKDKFNKNVGLRIARTRAVHGNPMDKMPPQIIVPVYNKMCERGARYFQDFSAIEPKRTTKPKRTPTRRMAQNLTTSASRGG